MKKLKVNTLRAGMKFDKPVYIEGNNIFVPPEIPIKEKDINRLINWEIDEVFTDGSIIIADVSTSVVQESPSSGQEESFPFMRELWMNFVRFLLISKMIPLVQRIFLPLRPLPKIFISI